MDLDAILDAVVVGVESLGLTYGEGTEEDLVPVVKRKIAKREKGIDPAVQITVSGSVRSPAMVPRAFGRRLEVFIVDITVVSSNNNDQLSNLDLYAAWRTAIERKFFAPPLYGVSEVFDLNILQGSFLDVENIQANYDVQLVRVEVSAVTNY